jgi:hypothetical protein
MHETFTQPDLFGEVSKPIKLVKKHQRHVSIQTTHETLTWSYGGGTQSVALVLLVAMGKLPKPDLIVMADTGDEATETWEYTFRYVLPLLDTLGLTIELAPHELATVDLYGHNGDLLLPAYTHTGRFPTYCSSEWKKYVFRRYVRSKGIERCVTWLGMSADEVERIKPSEVQWQQYAWPLAFDVPLTRAGCVQLVLNYGWPHPPKSCCWDCPNRRNPQWLRLKTQYPGDFARAVTRDKQIRAADPLHAVYLHASRQPLDEVDFTRPDTPLFSDEHDGCQTGYCFV